MRVVLAHHPSSNVNQCRRALLGAGLDCSAEDCVAWDQLAVRLAQSDADLVVVKTQLDPPADWNAVRQATTISMAPVVAIGPSEGGFLARGAGISAYVDEANLRVSLDEVLERMRLGGPLARRRGQVISVLAAAAGSGGTTVALNLTGALAKQNPGQVALIELTRQTGDVALLLNAKPNHTIEEICRRWQNLDAMSLISSAHQHAAGFYLLANPMDGGTNPYLTTEAVRRAAVLARVAWTTTVVALDPSIDEEEEEALRLSDRVALVVRPDVVSVRRAQTMLTRAESAGVACDRIRLVINRWGQPGQLDQKQIESSLGLAATALIPEDPARINRAGNSGLLLSETALTGKIGRRFAALATLLVETNRPAAARTKEST